MEDLIPKIFTTLNFFLFSGQMYFVCLDRQTNLCILIKLSAKQFYG